MTLAHNARGEFDQHAATELKLFIDNRAELMGPNSQGDYIRRALLKRIKKGTFDQARSVDAWMHLVDSGAQRYAKEFADRRDWHQIFSVPTRRAVATEIAEEFYTEAKLGNYDPNRSSPKPLSGYAYETTNHWQESSDEDWDTVMYTPTGSEKFVGVRTVDGSRVNVWKGADGYVAQLEHMTRNHKGLLRRNGGTDYLIRKQSNGRFYLYSFDAWTDAVSILLESANGYDDEAAAFRAATRHANRIGTLSAVVKRENADGGFTQVGSTGDRYSPGRGLTRNADLPKPRRTVDTSLSRVSRMEREQHQREKPFDPEKRYPRGTKPHHFAINPTDPRDVPHNLRAVRVSYYRDDPDRNGQSVKYDTFENGTAAEGEPQWYEIEDASGSDYSGGSVARANYNELVKLLEEHHPEDQTPVAWVSAYGGHNTKALFVVYDELDDEIKETLGALTDYPVVDDEALSELEGEEQDEAWDNFYKRDFERAVMKGVNAEYPDEEEVDDWPDDTDSSVLLRVAMDLSNTYWEHTTEGPYLDMKRVVPVAVDLITGVKQEPGHSVEDHKEIEKIRHGFDLELPK